MLATVTLSTVRQGVATERARFQAVDWPDAAARLEEKIGKLSHENPDTILITMERPK